MAFITTLTAVGPVDRWRARLTLWHDDTVEPRRIGGLRRFAVQRVMGADGSETVVDDIDVLTVPRFNRPGAMPENLPGSQVSWTSGAVNVPTGAHAGEILPGRPLDLSFLWPCPLSPHGRGFYLRLHIQVESEAAPSLQLRVGEGSRYSLVWLHTRDWPNGAFEWRAEPFSRDFAGSDSIGEWIALDRVYNVAHECNWRGHNNWALGEVEVLRDVFHEPATDLPTGLRGAARLTFQRDWGDERMPPGDVHRPRIVADMAAAPAGDGPWANDKEREAEARQATDSVNPRLSDRIFGWGAGWSYRTGAVPAFRAAEPAVLGPAAGDRTAWLLAMRLPPQTFAAAREPDAPTPGAIWQRTQESVHFGGLNALSARRPITYLPVVFGEWRTGRWAASASDDTWWLRFAMPTSVEGDTAPLGPPSLRAIVAPRRARRRHENGLTVDGRIVEARFPNVSATDGDELRRRLVVATPDDDPLRPVAPYQGTLRTTATPEPVISLLIEDAAPADGDGVSQSLRLGALDIHLAAQANASGQIVLSSDSGPRQQLLINRRPVGRGLEPAYELDYRLTLRAARVDVGGQDPEFGFADEDRRFQRGRPITIPLHDTTQGERAGAAIGRNLDFEVQEIANAQRSHTVEVRIVSEDRAALTPERLDAVVLDPDSFAVARVLGVLSPPDGRIVASFRRTSETAGEWELSSGQRDDAVLIVPPQVIGETFIKGSILVPDEAGDLRPLLDPEKPLDYRLAPPARLLVDRSIQPRARTTAPWNLRRLLGYSDDEAPGVALLGVDMELLYGLPFLAADPDFRLVEIEGWAGRLAVSQSIVDALDDASVATAPRGATTDYARQSYAADLRLWIAHIHKRLGHWQPYRRLRNVNAQGVREPETLASDVTHRFRATRQTAHPFQIGDYAIDEPPGQLDVRSKHHVPPWPEGAPLYGGVDWLFESRNIYGEVLFKPRARSSVSTVSNLALTALGGRGNQKASFANDKTIVSSVTEDGRTKRVTLTRIGRIAMLWNRAKHVIVYERTVKTAARYRPDDGAKGGEPAASAAGFQGNQPTDFEGLALMRKVREYIEILEPMRSYPDFPGADTPSAGCLIESAFESRQIDVRSEWGYDTATGWAIPLWGPVEASKQAYYPKPNIQLRLARAAQRGGGGVWHEVKHPSVLRFYTSTLASDRADTDAWPAVADIDYDILPDPNDPEARRRRGELASMAEDPDGRLPDALDVEPGYDRFTVDLEPAEEAVNLAHGREGDGVEARVHNIMLARSSRVLRPESDPGAATATAVAAMGADSAAFADRAAHLAAELRRAAREGRDDKVERARLARLARSATKKLDKAERTRADLEKELPTPPQPTDWRSPQEALNALFLERLESVAKEVAKTIGREVAYAIANPIRAEDRLKALQGQLARLVDEEAVRLRTQIEAFETVPERMLLQLGSGARLATARLQQGLDSAVGRVLLAIDALDDSGYDADAFLWHVRERLLPLIVDLRSLVRDLLNGVVDSLDGLPTPFLSGLRERLAATLEEVAQIADGFLAAAEAAMAPEAVDGPDLDDIREQLQALAEVPADLLAQALEELLDGIRGENLAGLADLRERLLAQIDDWSDDLQTQIADLKLPDLPAGLATLAEDVAKLVDEAAGPLHEIAKDVNDQVADLVDNAKAEFGDLVQTGEALKDQYKAARKSLDDVIADLQNTGAQLEDLADQMERDLGELKGRLRPLENLVRDAAKGDLLRGNPGQVAARTLRMVRALGDAPVAGTLDYTRRRLGYYFDAADQIIQSTPAATLFNRVPDDVANALGIRQPFKEIGRRLIPDFGRDFDLRKMLPDFGGLKLADLLPDVKVPGAGDIPDWIKITHGFNEKTLSAWALCDIDTELGGRPRLFDAGPVSVFLVKPRFDAHSRMEIDVAGRTTTDTDAKLTADIVVSLGNQPVATIKRGLVHFNNAGKLKVDIDARNIELAPTMQFMTDLLSVVGPDDSGVRFVFLPEGGLSTQINLPLPDLTGGAFSITGLSLNTRFDLLFASGFALRSALWLSKPDRPFNISVLFLGGGGWFGVDVYYKPPRDVRARLTIGIAAGATAALNLGVASGIAQFLLSLSVEYRTSGGASSGPRITIALLTYGELRVIGIISLYIGLGYQLTYDGGSGSLTGTGWLRVRIKICWCVKITVSTSVSVRFAGSAPRRAGPESMSVSTAAAVDDQRLNNAKQAHRDHFATLSV